MDEMLKLMEALFHDEPEKKDPKVEAQVEADMRHFKSLVPYREIEAVRKVCEAVDNMRKVQAEEMSRVLHDFDEFTESSTAMSRCHYMVWCDMCKDLYQTARSLDVDVIARSLAEMRAEKDFSYTEMERIKYVNEMFKFLRK